MQDENVDRVLFRKPKGWLVARGVKSITKWPQRKFTCHFWVPSKGSREWKTLCGAYAPGKNSDQLVKLPHWENHYCEVCTRIKKSKHIGPKQLKFKEMEPESDKQSTLF